MIERESLSRVAEEYEKEDRRDLDELGKHPVIFLFTVEEGHESYLNACRSKNMVRLRLPLSLLTDFVSSNPDFL